MIIWPNDLTNLSYFCADNVIVLFIAVSNHIQDWKFDLRSYRKFFCKPEPSFEQINISKKIKRKGRRNSLTKSDTGVIMQSPQRSQHVRKVKTINNNMSIASKKFYWLLFLEDKYIMLYEMSFTDHTKYSTTL